MYQYHISQKLCSNLVLTKSCIRNHCIYRKVHWPNSSLWIGSTLHSGLGKLRKPDLGRPTWYYYLQLFAIRSQHALYANTANSPFKSQSIKTQLRLPYKRHCGEADMSSSGQLSISQSFSFQQWMNGIEWRPKQLKQTRQHNRFGTCIYPIHTESYLSAKTPKKSQNKVGSDPLPQARRHQTGYSHCA